MMINDGKGVTEERRQKKREKENQQYYEKKLMTKVKNVIFNSHDASKHSACSKCDAGRG